MKVFERAIRRASIPAAMSQGFNPHLKFSIPLALGVGIVGRDEVLELELRESMTSEMLVEGLSQQLPKEIRILSAEVIPYFAKSSICDVRYEVAFKDAACLNTLDIRTFLQQPSVIVNRIKNGHQKPFDIRPSIQEIEIKPDGLILAIRMTSEGMARPEEVLRALCKNEKIELFEIIRTKVNLSSSA